MTRSEVYKLIENHYRKHYDRQVSVASRQTGSHHTAEEAVQEAYTRACEYWKGYARFVTNNPPDSNDNLFYRWFETVLTNCISRKWNEEKRQGMQLDDESDNQPSITEDGTENKVVVSEIRDMIKTKKPSTRYILELHLFNGMDPSDIRHLVPKNLRAVEQVLRRFKAEVREHYA